MDSENEVIRLSNELSLAISVIMDPNVSQQARMDAYVACEKFKDMSPYCAQAGLYLASGPFNPNVRHFGLQLMEHTVKFKWNCISQEEKIFIKDNAMKLLSLGVGAAEDASISHIKDALSRIIVEMIKREWPQQWTTLLSELSEACAKGEPQTELVLLIFLRLVEDVALLQTLESNQRRKDIYQALTVNMTEIFNFFLRLIELHVNGYRSATSIGEEQKARAHSRVVQVVLLTLTGFVEWVSIVHILAEDGRLIHILCILLNDYAFQIPSADCLAIIVNRKGQVKERKPLAMLFSKEAIDYIYRAVQPSAGIPPEHHYSFLKKVIPVLSGIVSQICTLCGKEEQPVLQPTQLSTLIQTIFAMARHPSLTITHGAALMWNTLLKNEHITKEPIFLEHVPKVIEVVGPKVLKIQYPSARTLQISDRLESFACIDYDSEEEFATFFYRCRTDILEVFRLSTLIAPLVTFAYCEHWIRLRLQKSTTEHTITCSIHDPVYLEWEALSVVLDSVLSRILMVNERPSVQTGLFLLEECLRVDTRDPLILSILLTCISSLFVFLNMSSCQITTANCAVAMGGGVTLLPRVLEKVFACVIFQEPSQPIATKNLRRHSASLLVKLSIKYPLLLLPVFEQINSTYKNLVSQPTDTLSKMEQTLLQEALLVISNNFCDYERQTAYVADVIQQSNVQWAASSNALLSARDFIRFVGLDKAPVGEQSLDPHWGNRSNLNHALTMVLGVVKRCSWPDDPDRASRGGFVVGLTESGNPFYRNPATPYIVPILPKILCLARIFNEMYSAESSCHLSDGFKQVNDMLDQEKKNLMGMPPVLVDPLDPSQKKQQTMLARLQLFLNTMFENCYHLLGSSGPALGRDLYELAGIGEALVNSVFSNLVYVPDYRLRTIIRVFLKPFIYSCPPAFYDSVLMEVFKHLLPLMFNRLSNRWKYITSLYESGELGEDITDTQEVLEDMLNRTLTREYLDVLKVALVGATIPQTVERDNSSGALDMDQDDHSMDIPTQSTRAHQSALASEVISDLGAKLLRNPNTCDSLCMTILNAVAWNDTACSFKAVLLSGPVLRFLANEELLNTSLASNILLAVLQGLQLHGQHEGNQSTLITLGVQAYEILRPKFPHIVDIMHQIPNTNQTDIQKLDEKVLMGTQSKGNKIDKYKKDLFKKITAQLVGKNIGQLFRKEIFIANLRPMATNAASASYTSSLLDLNNQESTNIAQLYSNS